MYLTKFICPCIFDVVIQVYTITSQMDAFSDGNFLAVGSRDNIIYVYTVSDNYRKYTRAGKCTVSLSNYRKYMRASRYTVSSNNYRKYTRASNCMVSSLKWSL